MPTANNLRSVFRPPQHLLLLLLFLGLGPFLLEAIVNEFLEIFCGTTGNFTDNSPYEKILRSLMRSISSDNSVTYGFYNFTYGQAPNQVNGIVLCWGDVALSDCRSCIKNSSLEIVRGCPVQKEAIIYYDYCLLRYCDQLIFRVVETGYEYEFSMWNINNQTDVASFSLVLGELMYQLRIRAAAGSSTQKFAAGNETGPDLQTLYGLAQCTPDLSELQCNNCLVRAIWGIFEGSKGKIGGRWVGPSCNIRFEVYHFYDPSAEAQAASPVSPPNPTTNITVPPPEDRPTKKEGSAGRRIVITTISAIVILALLLSLTLITMKRMKGRRRPSAIPYVAYFDDEESSSMQDLEEDSRKSDLPLFSLSTISAATEKFSFINKLGQGGFGSVYKGVLENGREIAVKRLSKSSGQGMEEFKNEVKLIAKLQHRNLVKMLGYSIQEEEKTLIYEYLPNKSLDSFLFGKTVWKFIPINLSSSPELTDPPPAMPMANNLQSVFWPPHHLLVLLLLLLLGPGPFLLEAAISCGTTGNFTVNSTYGENLRSVLSSVSSVDSRSNGFYKLSSGRSPDRAYVIALCRGDLARSDCQVCLKDASDEIVRQCPVQKEAFIWYDNCMLWYSNQSIYGFVDNFQVFFLCNNANATSGTEFSLAARELMEGLRIRAAAGNSTLKFAARHAPGPDNTIYALAQCSPDLSESQCNDCLLKVIDDFPKYCAGKIGARAAGPNCNMRYEVYRFYEPSADAILAPAPVSPPTPSTNRTEPPTTGISGTARTVIIVIASIAAVFLLVISIFCIYRRKARKPFKKVETSDLSLGRETTADEIMTAESLQHDFEMVRAATNNFSEENKLGEGGFGSVYKGTLASGQEIAVKRLSRGQWQRDQEFKTEVLLVARLQHRNLARLLGFCLSGDERLLIYEFMPNSSLDRFIFDPVKRQQLDWEKRQKIIGGIARGLLYLHEDSQLRIIHRDIKASNILLDAEMTPKISDFGTARLFAMDETHEATDRIVGTYGYMAPEYGLFGQFSVKSDVFSFGVLVLEIVSGQKNNAAQSRDSDSVHDLMSIVWRSWREGTLSNIVDPLLSYMPMNEIQRCIHIGLLCVQENAAKRPNMTSVLLMLNSFSISLAVPTRPAFYRHGNMESTGSFPAMDNSRGTGSDEPKSKSYHGSVDEDPITDLSPR